MGKNFRRHLLVAAVMVALAAGLMAPAQAATPAEKYAAAAVKATNVKRVAHDRGRLAVNTCLRKMAARQAQRMADQTSMFHQKMGPIQKRCHMGWVGENVAVGYLSGLAVVNAWMGSPEHRKNLLARHFTLVGIAVRKGSDGLWYASQVFGSRP
jgi:uncharacterized protein YkwD